MTKRDAERIIAVLDNLSARCRDIEVGIDRIRRELQDEFRVPGYGYAAGSTPARRHAHAETD